MYLASRVPIQRNVMSSKYAVLAPCTSNVLGVQGHYNTKTEAKLTFIGGTHHISIAHLSIGQIL
jgi:hypothetical protein